MARPSARLHDRQDSVAQITYCHAGAPRRGVRLAQVSCGGLERGVYGAGCARERVQRARPNLSSARRNGRSRSPLMMTKYFLASLVLGAIFAWSQPVPARSEAQTSVGAEESPGHESANSNAEAAQDRL